ncbi:IS3 family transposase [uncultured Sphaerochaeta sp.]|uniref:IS3 family transposase n=1 Tax=uncultured Sphaerochaeta sp. TaxID=886478 RepID=UPI002A0A38BC|nr:IS3 family transposase [uncultured Sphaerochaeta sp.]
MYSYEERKKAVFLYMKYGKSISAVIRELGYPDRKSLTKWYQEFKVYGDLPKASKQRYTEKQKNAAVTYYKEYGRSLARTVRMLGYPSRAILGEWVHEYLPVSCHPVKRGKSVVQYTDEQKIDAVISVASGEKTARELETEIGVTRSAVSQWKRQLFAKGERATMGKTKPGEPDKDKPGRDAELREECEILREERDRLQRQVCQLQMEKDILEKAASLLKKRKGIDIENLSNREKAVLVDALARRYRLKHLLASVHMAKSSFFYQRNAMQKDKYASVRERLRTVFEQARSCYGYRRLHVILTAGGQVLSEKVVLRLMHEERLDAGVSKRKKYSSYMGEIDAGVTNLLQRDFHAENPNEKWLSDITEFSIPAGKVYLSPIVDCFDGYVTSWTRGPSPNAEMVNSMLDKAVGTLKDGECPLVHTDRGCHYRWPGWIERMDNAGLVRSMSKKGCSPDNSACEGFFGRLKNEMFYIRSWFEVSIEEFCTQLDDYICWYNEERIKMSLGGRSPMEYRRNLGLIS